MAGQPVELSLVQMRCEKADIEGNLAQIEAHVMAAESDGTDILVFPEMSVSGYVDPVRMPDAMLSLDGREVEAVVAMTRGRTMTVLAGIVEANGSDKPFITQIVARGGKLLGFYRKTTIAEDESSKFAPGREAPLFRHADLVFGVAICADGGNRGLFEAYARSGAQAVFSAAAPGLYGEQATRDWQAGFEWWRRTCAADLGTHAREFGLWIGVATQAGRTVDEDFPGGGYVFRPGGECIAATTDWSECTLRAVIGQ